MSTSALTVADFASAHLCNLGHTVDVFPVATVRRINQSAALHTFDFPGLGIIVVKTTSKATVVVECTVAESAVDLGFLCNDSTSAVDSAPVFAVGDRVRVVTDALSLRTPKGSTGTITHIDRDDLNPYEVSLNPYEVSIDGRSPHDYVHFDASEIEPMVPDGRTIAEPIDAPSVQAPVFAVGDRVRIGVGVYTGQIGIVTWPYLAMQSYSVSFGGRRDIIYYANELTAVDSTPADDDESDDPSIFDGKLIDPAVDLAASVGAEHLAKIGYGSRSVESITSAQVLVEHIGQNVRSYTYASQAGFVVVAVRDNGDIYSGFGLACEVIDSSLPGIDYATDGNLTRLPWLTTSGATAIISATAIHAAAIERQDFAVGDRVKVTTDSLAYDGVKPGDIGTVIGVNGPNSINPIAVQLVSQPHSLADEECTFFSADEIEIAHDDWTKTRSSGVSSALESRDRSQFMNGEMATISGSMFGHIPPVVSPRPGSALARLSDLVAKRIGIATLVASVVCAVAYLAI